MKHTIPITFERTKSGYMNISIGDTLLSGYECSKNDFLFYAMEELQKIKEGYLEYNKQEREEQMTYAQGLYDGSLFS